MRPYGPTGIGVLSSRREWLAALPPFMTGGQMIGDVTLTGTAFRPPPRRDMVHRQTVRSNRSKDAADGV